jgi:anaerobic glycerol-3-phosphate dehydrogenase
MSLDAMATPIPAAAGQIFTGTCELRGWSLRTSVAATVTLFDNTSGAGTILGTFDTIAGQLAVTVAIATGLRAAIGVFAVASAGTLSGSVWIA